MENKYHYVIKLLLESETDIHKLGVSFCKGEEKELASFLAGLKEYSAKNDNKKDDLMIQKRVSELLKNSFYHFQWETVFENLDLSSINNNGIELFDEILKSTYYDVFLEKVNKCNDPVIACYYYSKYAEVNALSKEVLMGQFIQYFEDYKERSGLSYEDILAKLMGNYYYDKKWGEVDIEESLTYVYYYLLGKVKINQELQSKFLRYIVACFTNRNRNLLIRRFFEVMDTIYFDFSFDRVDKYSEGTNIVELKIYTSDFEEAAKAFNDSRFPLYDEGKLAKLTSDFCYSQENNKFIDRLDSTLRMLDEKLKYNRYGGFKEEYLLQIIYSEKIKIINDDSIHIIHRLLSENDFKKFMLHVIDDGIVAYTGEETLFTADYLNTKMARKLSGSNVRYMDALSKLLVRDQYTCTFKK